MSDLFDDSKLFPQVGQGHVPTTANVHWHSDLSEAENVSLVIWSLLGPDFELREPKVVLPEEPGHELALFDVITSMLPLMDARSGFLWHQLVRPHAQMMNMANFSLSAQCIFLVFVYARVLGLLGPEKPVSPGSVMTLDGSPIEYSWVIPNQKRGEIGEANRQVRFAIEPMDPSGSPLKGAAVLDYFATKSGGLGVVQCGEDSMMWRTETENFMFAEEKERINIPKNSRFFVGFDFMPTGSLTLKAYYITFRDDPFTPPSANNSHVPYQIAFGDDDFSPLRPLVCQLHHSLGKPFELFLDYTQSLETASRPRMEILAMDCIDSQTNRLKIYARNRGRASWSDAKRSFTLDGRLRSSLMDTAISRLEILWNLLFPKATSQHGQDLDAECTINVGSNPHPQGGLLFYYELVPGTGTVFPKIYLPIRVYCPNDLASAQALERFYDQIGVDAPGDHPSSTGWVAREITKLFGHRSLDECTGIQTYVAFALKRDGWELTNYFSPELWRAVA